MRFNLTLIASLAGITSLGALGVLVTGFLDWIRSVLRIN